MNHNRNHTYNKVQQMDMKLGNNNNTNNSASNLQQRFSLPLSSRKSKLYRCLLIQVVRFRLEDFNKQEKVRLSDKRIFCGIFKMRNLMEL